MARTKALAALAATIAIAGCVPRPAPPAPAPAPPPPPARPAPPSPPPPAAAPVDWRDAPLSDGDWSWQGGLAEFRGDRAEFALRCDSGGVRLVLGGGQGQELIVRTSYGERRLPANATLPAGDPLLDEIAFSRGRFQVAPQSGEALILPAWPEVARVIEECRGA